MLNGHTGEVQGGSKKHVVIVGAGVGGTALAARLAARGYQVTVLEKVKDFDLKKFNTKKKFDSKLYLIQDLLCFFYIQLFSMINLEDDALYYKLKTIVGMSDHHYI